MTMKPSSSKNPAPLDAAKVIKEELDKLRLTQEADAPPGYLKACIYGDPGVGKTCLSCQLGKKVLHLRVDPGYTVLDRHPDIKANIWVPMQFERLEQIEAIVYAFDNGIEPYCQSDLIVIDTFAEAQDQDLTLLVDVMTYHKSDKRPHPQLPGWDDYNLSKRRMSPLIDNLTRIPVDVVYICHVREPVETDKIKTRRPDLPNSIYLKLARYCNLIGYMTRTDTGKRNLQTQSSPTIVAKTQIVGVDGTINADTLPALIADWKNK